MKKVTLFVLLSLSLLIANDKENIKELYLKSYNYEKMGLYSESIKVLTPLLIKYPKGYTLNLRSGWLFYLSKKYNDAIKYYQKAILLNQYSLEARLGLIRVYLDTYRFSQAEQKCYELLKIDFYNYYANIYLIQALNAQKKYDISLKVTKKMLTLYPTDIKYLELLAVIYEATKSPLLHQLYNDILILDPNNIYVKTKIRNK